MAKKYSPMTIVIIIVFAVISIFFVCCRYFIKKERKTMHSYSHPQLHASPVIITSTSHTTPYGQPGCAPQPGFAPYPNVAPAPGFAGYPPQSTGPSPYPTQQYTQAPYPPHNATTTAYPTPSVAPVAVAESMNPPTYDQAVHGDTATAPVTAPVTAGYQKQAPYNPNF